MFSLVNSMNPQFASSLVDTFFECKKAQVKQRLRDSMEVIVDELFGELVRQVKEMFVPRQASLVQQQSQSQVCASSTLTPLPLAPKLPAKAKSPKMPSKPPVLAVKSAVLGTSSSQPMRGIKRPLESMTAQNLNDIPQLDNAVQESLSCSKKLVIDEAEPEAIGGDSELLDTEAIGHSNLSQNKDNFVCSIASCGKRFKKNSHLMNHERTHSGIKPFLCKYPGCSYTAAERSVAIRHIRNVHLKGAPANDADPDGNQQMDPKEYLEVNQELLNSK